MARSSASFPQPLNFTNWQEWARAFLQKVSEQINRTQKLDEEYEPPNVVGTGSRLVLTDSDGVRWAVTVDTGGNVVTTAL